MRKFDIKYVGREGSILAATLVVTSGLGLLVPLLFNECSTVAAYGVFQYINVIVSLVGITSLHGMNNAILVAAARGHDRVLRRASLLRFKTSLLVGCPILLASGLVFSRAGGDYVQVARACFILLPFFPAMFSFMGVYSYLNGKRRFTEMAALQILYSIGNVGLICVCLGYFPQWVFLPAVASLVFKTLLEMGLFFALVRRERIAGGATAEGEERKLIAYGLKMSMTQLVGLVQARLDRFVVGTLYGFSDLGSFGAGRAVVPPLRGLLVLYPRLYIPKLAQRPRPLALRSTYKALALGVLGAIPVFLLLVLAVPWAYEVLLPRFPGSGTYARYFVVVVFLGVPFYFFYGFFQSQIMARREFVVRAANAAVLILSMIVLIKFFGLMGVIYAQMLAAVVLSVHSWFEARRSVYSNGNRH